MEKLSFAGIENSLSRDEMRKIMAGSGGCDDYDVYCYRAEDFSDVTTCTVCVKIDPKTCTASCDDTCCLA